MSFIVRFAALLAVTLGMSASAFAQLTQPPSFADAYYAQVAPLRGAYYDPSQSGQGIMVDIGPDGTMFVGVFHHELTGAPSFRTMQGKFEPTYAYPQGTELLRYAPEPGSLGTLRSQLYLTTGGNCLSCPHRPVSTVPDPALGFAELTFYESRRATLRIGQRTLSMRRLQIDRTDVDLLAGRWLFAVWEGNTAAEALATIEVSPMPSEALELSGPCCGYDSAPPLPSSEAKWFRVICIERCAGFDAWRTSGSGQYAYTSDVVIWYEPVTGKAVLDQFVRREGRLLAPLGRRFHDLSIDANLVTGRASYRSAYVWVNTNAPVPTEGTLLQMTRLPNGKRICTATTCP